MSDKDTAIEVKNLSKDFVLPHKDRKTLKSFFLNPFSKVKNEKQHALHDVSFEVKKGDFFGIVGRNGSGKSTLLKCIAGVYHPTKGHIKVNGSLVPFIELGVGFNPELTGRENVFLNGSLLGFSRQEMDAMYDEIVEFSELERFMDQKLKNYSSGMQVRLAFSIAIRAKGDILLLDEVLAVGDSAFQRKCSDYFASLKKGERTIVLVSHNMAAIEKYCDRALLLEDSEIKGIGLSEEIADMYEDTILQTEAEKKYKKLDAEIVERRDHPKIDIVTVIEQNNRHKNSVKAFREFKLRLKIKSEADIEALFVGINIKNSEKTTVFAADTIDHVGGVEVKKGEEKEVYIELENVFTNGAYYINYTLASMIDNSKRIMFKVRNASTFTVYGVHQYSESLIHPKFKLGIKDE